MITRLIIQNTVLLLTFILSGICTSSAQLDTTQNDYLSIIASPQVHKKRRNLILSLGSASYAAGSYILYRSWYEDSPRSSFHFYNDWGEWRKMDKVGHVFSTYNQAWLAYQGWKWSGLTDKKAIWSGVWTSLLFQSTIEVMDGFSKDWGFSLTDMGANLVGASLFAAQEFGWAQQRIRIKYSYSPVQYTDDPLAMERSNELFGSGFLQRELKDYNGQTYWLSANVNDFFPNSELPEWLNISIGYGAANMFGGFTNRWVEEGQAIEMDLPRYSQFYLSLDMDLSKIKTASPFLRTLLDILNIIKIPFSALEINTVGEVKMHLLKF